MAALMSPIEVNALSTGPLSPLFFFFNIYTFILLLLRWPFSRGGEWGLLSVAVLGLLIAELGL